MASWSILSSVSWLVNLPSNKALLKDNNGYLAVNKALFLGGVGGNYQIDPSRRLFLNMTGRIVSV